MKIEYVPLVQVMRDLHGLPRGMQRFREYLDAFTKRGTQQPEVECPPLVFMNPMGGAHVTELLDALLALDADGIAARAAVQTSACLADAPGDFRLGLVVADDRAGGWTNRYDYEFNLRFTSGSSAPGEGPLPKWLKHRWLTSVLWSSEPATVRAVREAVLTTVHRAAYLGRHGFARTLREKLQQEGHVLHAAGCDAPAMDAEELAYAREVIAPFLDTEDKRTTIECLFGDAAGRTLGFTPRGLSLCAGLALALHDARSANAAS
jgi:hypothetical protein